MNDNVKQIVSNITSKNKIKSVYFVACGGSLSGFYPAKYFLAENTKTLNVGYMNANEFVYATPKDINEEAVVILASQRGNTAETVEACKVANGLNAHTIGLVYMTPSPLQETANQAIAYEFGEESNVALQKSSYGLKLAIELLNQIEGYDQYDQINSDFEKLHGIVANAKVEVKADAIRFALDYKDSQMIYMMGSGACWGSAHQEHICILLEMQWIPSCCIHSGEYFHGPFEITEKNTAFVMLKSTGRTKALDDRAISFLDKFNEYHTIIDASKLGLDLPTSEYLEPLFYNNILNVYNVELANQRNHPLTTRRYMWRFAY